MSGFLCKLFGGVYEGLGGCRIMWGVNFEMVGWIGVEVGEEGG